MEKALVTVLLEKYWQAETTIAEEQALAAYFQGEHVDPELQAYSDLFSYFHEEAQVSAGADFGNRILHRLGLPLDGEEAGEPAGSGHEIGEHATSKGPAPVIPAIRQTVRLGMVGAAAAIVLIVAAVCMLRPTGQLPVPADTRLAARTRPTTGAHGSRVTGSADIADTYDDPGQALEAVRQALLVASRNLNQSRREITGDKK